MGFIAIRNPGDANILAGLLLFFLSGLLGPESWDAMESALSTPRVGSAISSEVSDGMSDCSNRKMGVVLL
jgi:hypothetical protein